MQDKKKAAVLLAERGQPCLFSQLLACLTLYTKMKWHLLYAIVFSLPHIEANEVSPQWL